MNNKKRVVSANWTTLLALLLSASLLALMLLPGCSCSSEEPTKEPTAQEEVPNVVGMTQADAERMITGYGFTLGKTTEEESSTFEAGTVISQSRVAGKMADLGLAIDIVVSKGVDKPAVEVAVPDLTGMTQTQAEEALFALKLVPVPLDPVAKDDVSPGKIYQQSVAAGTKVKEGTHVQFTAALGNATAKVPQVTGMTKDEAVKALVNAGFNVDVHEEYNANYEAGKVSSQNPSPNIHVLTGTTISLMVSKGQAPVGKIEVPNFVTLTLPQAIQTANQAGLVIAPGGVDLNGVAVTQSPAPGTEVDPGATITINFGQPDV